MARKLADELIHMILSPSLAVSHDKFISSSYTVFGKNDTVSSASVLLVCKQWLRVATPLLYKTIVIRSTGQSQALVDVFRQNPTFAKHVKKIRIEGAYASLGDVLMYCSKMETLVILLRIYSDSNVNGLCRALSRIDPTEVILYDEYLVDNVKLRKAFVALCEAIPGWKNLTTFDFPYTYRSEQAYVTIKPGSDRQTLLVKALTKSSSIRFILCDLPRIPTTNDNWRNLAKIPSITIKFRYFSSHCKQKRVEIISKDLQLSKCFFEFIDFSGPRFSPSGPVEKIEKTPEQPFKSLRATSVPKSIWDIIFKFATVPGYPNPGDLLDATMGRKAVFLLSFNATRKRLSLVCTEFKQIIRPIFIAYPIICSHGSLDVFTSKVLQAPDLGRDIQTLFMRGSIDQETNEGLCILIPHLTCLQHLIGWGWEPLYISPKAFILLAESAGSTLTTLAGVEVRRQTDRLLPTILRAFKSLIFLDIDSDHFALSDKTGLPRDSLSSLRALRLGRDTNLLDAMSVLGFPQLRSVTSTQWALPPMMEKFLQACGSQVEELHFKGCANFADIFRYTPRLRDLRWMPPRPTKQPPILADVLVFSAAHAKLQKFTLEGTRRNSEKEQNIIIDTFFDSLDFTKFPSLKEIRFESYMWPTDERTILKDVLTKKATKVKQEHGIDVTDYAGKAWRPRVERR